MNKEQLLEQVKATYYYSMKLEQANNGIKDIKNRSNNLNNEIINVQDQISSLDRFGNQVAQLSYSPNIIEPSIEKIKKWPFIVVCGLLILFEANLPGPFNASRITGNILPILTIVLTVWLYKHINQSRYDSEYEVLNGENIRQINQLNNSISERVNNIKSKISQLNNYLPKLQDIKNDVDNNLLTKANAELQEVKESAPNNLAKIPSRRLGNSAYLLLLYEVIDTDQASSLGDAVRIVEDRFERAELNENLRRQIFESQKSLEKTLKWATNTAVSEINGVSQELQKSTEKLSNELSNISVNINDLNQSVVNNGMAIVNELQENNLQNDEIRIAVKKLQSKWARYEIAY